MKNKINLGIIGKNFGLQVVYKAFLKNKKFKVLGFSYKSKNFDKLKIPRNIKVYTDWKKLILDKKIQAVAVATPPVTHKNIVNFAIKNNKHIFCEKPFTCSVQETNDICKLIKKKNISHMVNYEFAEIESFKFFKNNILNKKIKIKKISLNWFIGLRKRSNNSWKEKHKKGGGMIFNYVCHSIFYLEFLFGEMSSIKSNISLGKKSSLDAVIFFKSGLHAQLKVKLIANNSKINPIHQLKVESDNGVYYLRTDVNKLSDQFQVIKSGKLLFKNKKSSKDFRIIPTFNNSKKFSSWILKGKKQKENFFMGQRIHLIINKMLLSSKKNKKVNIY